MNVLFCLTNREVIQSEETVTKKVERNQMLEKTIINKCQMKMV